MLAALWQWSTVEIVFNVSREVPLTKMMDEKWRSLRSRCASVRAVKTFGREHIQPRAQAQATNADVLGSRIGCGFCISKSSGLFGSYLRGPRRSVAVALFMRSSSSR